MKHKIIKLNLFLYSFIFLVLLFSIRAADDNYIKIFLGMRNNTDKPEAVSLITPTPTTTPSPSPTPKKQSILPKNYTPENTTEDLPNWGQAKQISEHEWTLRVGQDEIMATAEEIYIALNNYRKIHGVNPLNRSNSLENFAKERAQFFSQNKKLDNHQGFEEFLKNDKNFDKLGFYSLGENASIGYNMQAVHLIEWVYAADEGHNQNQLNPKWTNVGIGVEGTATDFIFGG